MKWIAHPYRSIAAALLLLLYGLACIPAVMWHAHPSGKSAGNNNCYQATDKKDRMQWGRHQVAGICKICSHHQPVIASLHTTSYEITTPVRFIRPATVLLFCTLQRRETSNQSNKGPPACL